jgi:tetratricopeptide (TPR) repeat protein
MPLYTCHTGYLYGLKADGGDEQALELALNRYQACLAEQPTPGWVDQVNSAALLWQSGQEDQARAVIAEAASQMPLQWAVWLNDGLVTDDDTQKAHAFGRVLALDPDLSGSPFWQQEDRAALWDRILIQGERAWYRDGEVKPYWRWQVAIAAGKWEPVVQETSDWLDLYPDDSEAMTWHSASLLALGSAQEALVWLDRALLETPAHVRNHLLRGEACLVLGQYNQAERDFRTALFLEPGNRRARLGLARLARMAGDEETAMREYSRSLRLPSITHGYDHVLYQRAGWPALLPQVARIGYKQDGEAALEWGEWLAQLGDLDGARQVYAMALVADPSWKEIQRQLEAVISR